MERKMRIIEIYRSSRGHSTPSPIVAEIDHFLWKINETQFPWERSIGARNVQ